MSKQKYPVNSSSSTDSDGSIRKGREHYSSVKLHAKRNRKRDEAEDRQAKYAALNVQERIELVKSRGGSKRELARLEALPKFISPHRPIPPAKKLSAKGLKKLTALQADCVPPNKS